MRNFRNILNTLIVVGVSALMSTGCKEDEVRFDAKAIMPSLNELTFDVQSADPQLITIYADSEWKVDEVPSWVTMEPTAGEGTTDVTITVTDNIREGAPDKPRKAVLHLGGNPKYQGADLVVNQNGDKYRDVASVTVSELVGLENDAPVIVDEAQVALVTTRGFIATDGQAYVYVLDTKLATVTAGDKISLKGLKGSDKDLPAVHSLDELAVKSTGEYKLPAGTDITSTIDSYSSTSREVITMTGVLTGTALQLGAFDGKDFVPNEKLTTNVSISDDTGAASSFSGHVVTITGFFAGIAKPYLYIHAADFHDLGVYGSTAHLVYYDNFNGNEDKSKVDAWKQPTAGDGIGSMTYTTGSKVDMRTSYNQGTTTKGGVNYVDYTVELWPDVGGHDPEAAHAHLYPSTNPYTPAECWIQINDLKFGASDKRVTIGMGVFGVGNSAQYSSMGPVPTTLPLYIKFDTMSDWALLQEISFNYNWKWVTLPSVKIPAGATTVSYRFEPKAANYVRLDDITVVADADGEGEIAVGPKPVVYFSDDFEWFSTVAPDLKIGDSVGTNEVDTKIEPAPGIYATKGASILAEFSKKGYASLNPQWKVVYAQKNYLKFSKTSDKACETNGMYNMDGLVLPDLKDVPAGSALNITFKWCDQRRKTKGGVYEIDPVDIVVEVANNFVFDATLASASTYESVWVSSALHTSQPVDKLEWQNASIDIPSYTPGQRIIIRPSVMSCKNNTVNRWYCDEISVQSR